MASRVSRRLWTAAISHAAHKATTRVSPQPSQRGVPVTVIAPSATAGTNHVLPAMPAIDAIGAKASRKPDKSWFDRTRRPTDRYAPRESAGWGRRADRRVREYSRSRCSSSADAIVANVAHVPHIGLGA